MLKIWCSYAAAAAAAAVVVVVVVFSSLDVVGVQIGDRAGIAALA